ncbi:MAG: sugar phosphate isomerase/epimerase family protein [Methanobacteriota archaeon]
MNKIGVSSLAFLRYSAEDTVRRVGELGFEIWEIIPEEKHLKKDYSKVKELAESYDLNFVVHAPFSDLNIASLNEGIREASLSQIFKSIELADFLEAELINIHPGRLSPLGTFFRERAWEVNLQSIGRILEFASQHGVKVSLENTPNFTGAFCCKLEEIQEVLQHFGGQLAFTLDVGHANTCGKIEKFIEALKHSLCHVHLHDNSGSDDTHAEIGKGNIDFKKVLRRLRKISYKSFFIIEALGEEEAFRSKEKLEELIL